VATAVNAGKVAVTQNPLSINWAQWMAFFRYLIPQMHWLLIAREGARAAFVQEKLERVAFRLTCTRHLRGSLCTPAE
jgi:hypothetical protein